MTHYNFPLLIPIIPTPREKPSPHAHILLQPLPARNNRHTILQHKQHARPLRRTRIRPRMNRRPLHRHIAARHQRATPIVQLQHHVPVQHDGVVQALRPVHHADVAGRQVQDPAHGAARVHEAQRARGGERFVRGDVEVCVQVGGHAGRRVQQVQHGFVRGVLDAGGLETAVDGGLA